MAMVLDSAGLSLPHAASSTIASHALASSAPFSALPRVALPKCSGLRISLPHKLPLFLPPSSRAPRGIVCEQQQETIAPAGAVTDKTWKTLVLESDIPVLVDFWAPWCGPCRMIAPLVDELAVQYTGRIRCLKLNTDESPTTATEYGIRSIPTVMFFKQGQKMDTIIGAVPKATLISTIEKYLER